ncbi:[acyl-carrier-protein] S-malonyltransferase [Streptomyces zhaozhouensis]|uniref:[acyl-carrier-protein] S-malonyltransferase n=1 Tax=Streptomyces zhaozhouensis TaxID=1300267 RepID=A0A286E7I3_9ACTN|nr:ACP S-malonyltransferase [Streptomyces zhaozhouensis]SOD66878.1 [acyl-carrier-protein] S-malonyltransferase [Streptomyces zhaozhouensis]
METEDRSGAAIVFPGMGAMSFEDVGKFMLVNPYARKLLATADEVLGYSVIDGFRDAEHDYAEASQVAFLINCLALAQWAEAQLGLDPMLCAGPSFGSKATTAYTGCLSVEDTVLMSARIARCQDEYFAKEHTDIVTHSFVRTPTERLTEILGEMDERDWWHDMACYVDDDMHMVSLREDALEWFKERVRGAGGLSLYTMRPPLHSSAFAALRRKAEEEVFAGLSFADPRIPVVSDHDGTLLRTGDQIRNLLLDGIVRQLRWPLVVDTLRAQGVGTVHVAGPDSLFGRVRRTTDNFEVVRLTPRMALRPRAAADRT